jgi:hypothetical protein
VAGAVAVVVAMEVVVVVEVVAAASSRAGRAAVGAVAHRGVPRGHEVLNWDLKCPHRHGKGQPEAQCPSVLKRWMSRALPNLACHRQR